MGLAMTSCHTRCGQACVLALPMLALVLALLALVPCSSDGPRRLEGGSQTLQLRARAGQSSAQPSSATSVIYVQSRGSPTSATSAPVPTAAIDIMRTARPVPALLAGAAGIFEDDGMGTNASHFGSHSDRSPALRTAAPAPVWLTSAMHSIQSDVSSLEGLAPSSVPFLNVSGWWCWRRLCLPQLAVAQEPLGHLWPTAAELTARPEAFQGRGLAFVVAVLLLSAAGCLLLEGLVVALPRLRLWAQALHNWAAKAWRNCAKGWKATSAASERQYKLLGCQENLAELRAEQDPEGGSDEEETLGVRSVSDEGLAGQNIMLRVAFGAFITAYHISCWLVVYHWSRSGMIAAFTGMDYECYLAWVVAMFAIHGACLLHRSADAGWPPLPFLECTKKAMLSVAPIISEPLDGFRDPVVAAIYASHGLVGLLPALMVALGALLPFFSILRETSVCLSCRAGR